jgi:formylglycine-generating enzyme required for sulfatase activity
MPRKPKTTQVRNVHAARDVILGDQYNVADLKRVESLLEQMLELLRQPQASVRIERDVSGSVIIIGRGNTVRFNEDDIGLLGKLQKAPEADAHRREEIYLTRFIMGNAYTRWDREYLNLAGKLLETAFRSSGRADKTASAGTDLLDVRQALTQFKKTRLVIVGEAGSGKTTTLRRLALDLARERLCDPVRGKLPVYVDLFNFLGDSLPSAFLRSEWENTGLSEPYGEVVGRGDVCFLLDGLDQMPLTNCADHVRRWNKWVNDELPPGNWAVFTCRAAEYALMSMSLPEVYIQPLGAEQIRRYLELQPERDVARRLWQDLRQQLRSGDDRFEKLVRNPFMLSLLVERLVRGRLKIEGRAELINDVIRQLLMHQLHAGRQPSALTANPPQTVEEAIDILGRLAFAMQARQMGTRLLHSVTLRLQLGDPEERHRRRRRRPILTVEQALNLAVDATVMEKIEGQDTSYAFYHHLVQEYFAAVELLRRFRAGHNLVKHWSVPWSQAQFLLQWRRPGERLDSSPVTGWEETVTLAAGLAGRHAAKLIELVSKDNLPLAGRCLAALGMKRSDMSQLAGQVRTALVKRQRDPLAHLRARIDAGLALGEMGHPDLLPQEYKIRRRVIAIEPPMQPVEAGEFIRGSDRDNRNAFPDEYTTERREYCDAFSIGRYPVTNAEFRCFIEDGGYESDRWWSKAGLKWKEGRPRTHGALVNQWLAFRANLMKQGLDKVNQELHWRDKTYQFWSKMIQLSERDARKEATKALSRPFDRPAYWDDPEFNAPAMPVVGVNWYEAQAYCRWLSAVTGRKYRLPTEVEWEKAARGTNGREYPWGNQFTKAKCNTVEGRIYTTAPVGLFDTPSPYGLFDACGNVCEWTANWYHVYPGGDENASDDFGNKFRVVRGGSWYFDRRHSRCASRDKYLPIAFDTDLGFRAVSPGG